MKKYAIYGLFVVLILVGAMWSAKAFNPFIKPATQEDPNRPRCNRHPKNQDKCEKCAVVCDEKGNRTHDNNCKNYCTEEKCDCDISCNP